MSMKSISKLLLIATLGLFLAGCAMPHNFVVVTSGTTIGFDVSQAPATSTPQATLAYKRVELAVVPVSTNGCVPDVLMDFDFKTSIFSSAGGIHSRLAVGSNATTQTPAALMMLKQKDGTFPVGMSPLQFPLNYIPSLNNTNK